MNARGKQAITMILWVIGLTLLIIFLPNYILLHLNEGFYSDAILVIISINLAILLPLCLLLARDIVYGKEKEKSKSEELYEKYFSYGGPTPTMCLATHFIQPNYKVWISDDEGVVYYRCMIFNATRPKGHVVCYLPSTYLSSVPPNFILSLKPETNEEEKKRTK